LVRKVRSGEGPGALWLVVVGADGTAE